MPIGKWRCSATRKMVIMTKNDVGGFIRSRNDTDRATMAVPTPRTPATAAPHMRSRERERTHTSPAPPSPPPTRPLPARPYRSREATEPVGLKSLASRARAASPAQTATAWCWLPVWEKGRVLGGRHSRTCAQGNRWRRIRGSNDAALSGWAGGRWIRESPDEVSSGECGLWRVEWTTGAAVPLEITVLLVVPSLRKGAIPHTAMSFSYEMIIGSVTRC